MPEKAHFPQPWGERVGGVSGRPIRATRRRNPLTYPERHGERHPDSRDAVSLRGLTEKRASWLVRLVFAGLVPVRAVAPATAGVLWENEEGNVVGARQARALFVVTPKKRSHGRGHVLHSVQRPVHVTRSFTLASAKADALEKGRSESRYRGRATPRKWEKPAPGSGRWTNVRLAARHRSCVYAGGRA